MSNIYEEYGLELESDNIPADDYGSPEKLDKPKKRKGGGWGKAIIAFFLGFIFAFGAVAGGGYYVLTQPIRPTVEMAADIADFDYATEVRNKILSEEYEDATFLEVFKELFKVIKDKNLVGLDNISPAVGDYLGKFVNNLNEQFGVKMDTDTLIQTEFAELPTYLGETFRTTPLGDMLKATSGNDELDTLLMEICYGQEEIHYHIDETTGEVVMLDGNEAATFETLGSNPTSLLYNISFSAVLPPQDGDALMLSIAYGRENDTYVTEKDADGNVVLHNNSPVVHMLPMYFEKNNLDEWTDYTGKLLLCNASAETEDFTKIEILSEDVDPTTGEHKVTDTYYVKNTPVNNRYYVYEAPTEDADAVYFKKTMIGDMAADSLSLIDNIMLKDALAINYYQYENEEDLPHPIMFSLAYGTLGVDYEVVQLIPGEPQTRMIVMKNGAHPRTIGDLRKRGNDIINDISISDIMSAEPDDALGMYLLYGKKGIHYELDEENNITLLQKYIAIDSHGDMYNEYGEWMDLPADNLNTTNCLYTDSHGNTYKYVVDPAKTIKVVDKTGQKSSAQVCYLTDLDGNPVMFTPHSLGELAGGDNLISRLTNRLTLSEVLGGDLSEHKLLKHVCDFPIDEIPDAITNLAVSDMFSEEVYGVGSIKYEGNTPLTDIHGAEIANGDYYFEVAGGYEKAALNGKWKYLLNDAVEDGIDHKPQDYTVVQMDMLLDNMTANVDKATLRQLDEDQIVDGLGDMIDTPIQTQIEYYDAEGDLHFYTIDGVPAGKEYLGDLTVSQMLDYTAKILSAPIF